MRQNELYPLTLKRSLLVSALILAATLLLIALCLGYFLPRGNRPEERRNADLDEDGKQETYILHQHRISVTTNGNSIWRSPPEWQVEYFVLGDATNDGRNDLVLVVWKQGSFGAQRPFWIKNQDDALSNHLFIFDLTGGKLHPLWMSSALDCPIYGLKIQDINGDGENELVVQEGSRGLLPFVRKETSLWQWKSWGFYRLDE